MVITDRLRERFCKDCNIPLRLFKEPYFTDRLQLYDKHYDTLYKWDIFTKELENYKCEQDYFEEYNRVKDEAISDIKESSGYKRFVEDDMNKYSIRYAGLPSKDVFKPSNDGKMFISIDMRKANFSALKHYDASIFDGSETWEEFISNYTDNEHIINSKYIRQVILGNCNPRRQVTYEKYLMDMVLSYIDRYFVPSQKCIFFSNDEIVLDLTDIDEILIRYLRCGLTKRSVVPLKIEVFILHKIAGTDGYYKEIIESGTEKKYEFKCLNNYTLPFVLRKFQNQEITENDKVFFHEGLLSKFIEVPEIQL